MKPSRLEELKSWWYWKVSSKYDATDIFMFTFFPCMIVAMLGLGYVGMIEKDQLARECEEKGGALVSTHKRHVCVDKKVIIK